MIDLADYWSSLTKEAIDSLIEKSDQISSDLIKMLEQKGLEKTTYEDLNAGWSGVRYVNYRLPCEFKYVDHIDFKQEAQIIDRTQSYCFEVCFRENLYPEAGVRSNLNDISVSVIFKENHQDTYIEKGFWRDQHKIIHTVSILEMIFIPFRKLDNTEYSGPYNGVLSFDSLNKGVSIGELMTAIESKEILIKNSQKEITELLQSIISTVNGFI